MVLSSWLLVVVLDSVRAAWFSRLVEMVDCRRSGTCVDGVDIESRGRWEAGMEGLGESQIHVLGLHLLAFVLSFQTCDLGDKL